jgi:hypothetical protein
MTLNDIGGSGFMQRKLTLEHHFAGRQSLL